MSDNSPCIDCPNKDGCDHRLICLSCGAKGSIMEKWEKSEVEG